MFILCCKSASFPQQSKVTVCPFSVASPLLFPQQSKMPICLFSVTLLQPSLSLALGCLGSLSSCVRSQPVIMNNCLVTCSRQTVSLHLHIESLRQSPYSSAVSLSLRSLFLFVVKLTLPFFLSSILAAGIHVEKA